MSTSTRAGWISRRSLLAAAGASIVGATFDEARAAEFTLKLGHDQPVDHPQNVRAMEAAADIARESSGRLVVRVYPSSQLGGDTQMLTQLRTGALELLQIGTNIVANSVPVAGIASLPFAYKGYQDLWSTLDGDLGGLIAGKVAALGLKVFDKWWDGGFRDVFTSERAVHAAADLKGLKLRVPEAPVQIAVFRALGASPTPVNNNELYLALQTRLVDGAEVPLSNIETARYYEVTKYLSLTRHQPTPYMMLGNAAAWKRLPRDLQEIAERCLSASAMRERQNIASGDSALEQRLKGQGLTLIDPDLDSFRTMVRQAGLFGQWRQQFGPDAFDALERSVGKLT